MSFTIKEASTVEEKSTQEIEKALLEKHERKVSEFTGEESPEKIEEEAVVDPEPVSERELTDEEVLTYIGKKQGREIGSMEDLMIEREATNQELPEDVEAYFKYKKDTGRGMEDFLKLSTDYDALEENDILRDYYKHTEEGLDADDITDLIDDRFEYDEDLDEESLVRSRKLKKKQEIVKARKFFNEQKETYNVPLESSVGMGSEAAEELKQYKQEMANAKTVTEENNRKSEWFNKKSDELFNDEFKGFEFKVNDKAVVFKPADTAELRVQNDTPFNFISKHLGEDGLLKDTEGYHKALAVAMNPDKFAKHFYEQGQADAIESDAKRSKNINMDTRRTPETSRKGGMQIRSSEPTARTGNGLVIPSNKRQ